MLTVETSAFPTVSPHITGVGTAPVANWEVTLVVPGVTPCGVPGGIVVTGGPVGVGAAYIRWAGTV